MFTKHIEGIIMNIYESEVLKQLASYKDISQRKIAKKTNFSLGTVNASINQLIARGFIDDKHHLTSKAINFIDENKPKRAIILAAGFGMRMVPINTETPKALLQIKNETIIEIFRKNQTSATNRMVKRKY